MTRLTALTGFLFLAVGLAACKSNTIPDFQEGAAAEGDPNASTNALGAGSGIGIEESGSESVPAQDLLNQLVVYFDYDKNEIRPEFNDLLAAHGQFLATHPNAQVRLEGHADERGSREYNIGLGERRAQAVRRILMLQGASAEQLSTVSYGEERPVASGHDEAAYQQNRRVEIVYRQ